MKRGTRKRTAREPLAKSPSASSVAAPPGAAALPIRAIVPLVAALLALFLLSQYARALHAPLVGDDYLFVGKTRNADFLSLWAPRALAFHYYRPWSRELYYWTLLHVFGPQALPFHVASLLLGIGTGVLYFLLARAIAGASAAATATAGVFALTGWGVLMVWAACCQDLWMLVLALGSLLAFVRGRVALATVLFALALLSKETAAVLPGIAFAWCLWIERRRWPAALARTAPLWAIVIVWAALHPMLGGRLVHPYHDPEIPGLHHPTTWIAQRTLLTVVNLEELPRPLSGWPAVMLMGCVGAAMLAALAALGLFAASADTRTRGDRAPSLPRIAGFGCTWALLGWLPLLSPSLGWHAYYAMFGMLGAWLALGALLARRPAAAIAVVAALAVVRAGRANTRSLDWGSEWFQWRAANFGEHTRDFLLRHHPSFPPHTRVYLTEVPGNVGLVPGGEESPALQVWYRDTTLQTRYLSRYQPRGPLEPRGADFFFRYDSTRDWREIDAGPEDLAGRSARDSLWADDQIGLTAAMLTAGDWQRSEVLSRKLVTVFPDSADHAYNLGVALYRLGERDSAARWFDRAAALPSATPAIVQAAMRFGSGRR